MKKSINICFILSILLSLTFSLGSEIVLAEGGEAGTIAEIEFYTDVSKAPPVDKGNTPEPTKKPKPVGRFPNTGDIVQKSLMVSGGLLALLGIYTFIIKQKKRKGDMK